MLELIIENIKIILTTSQLTLITFNPIPIEYTAKMQRFKKFIF